MITRELLLSRLAEHAIDYETIRHAPEGVTSRSSSLRGHPLDEAVKSMLLRLGWTRRRRGYLLVAVRGDQRVDFDALRRAFRVQDVALASRETTEQICGAPVGSIMPFTPTEALVMVADVSLQEKSRVFFNLRLDESIVLRPRDWERVARPIWARVGCPDPESQDDGRCQ